jgi:outer membrane cobalamin receptor
MMGMPTKTGVLYLRGNGSRSLAREPPKCRPESAWTYEAGLQWHSVTRLEAEANIFENRERNVIDYVQFFTGDINHAANIQRLNFDGVETSLKVHASATQVLGISYTWIHGTQQALIGLASSRYVFNYPINNAVVNWQGHLPWQILARTRIGATERAGRNPYAVWERRCLPAKPPMGYLRTTDWERLIDQVYT